MKMVQVDIFGGETDVAKIEANPRRRKRIPTMQYLYGELPGKRCKDCKHCFAIEYANRYYKCELWRVSNSAATDIRLRNAACKRFEQREDDVDVYQAH